MVRTSLPSWERGLKSTLIVHLRSRLSVAPLVGAWIEIWARVRALGPLTVAPLVGAWIEIPAESNHRQSNESLPSWERGLKCTASNDSYRCGCVAPLVGAWIEIHQT